MSTLSDKYIRSSAVGCGALQRQELDTSVLFDVHNSSVSVLEISERVSPRADSIAWDFQAAHRFVLYVPVVRSMGLVMNLASVLRLCLERHGPV